MDRYIYKQVEKINQIPLWEDSVLCLKCPNCGEEVIVDSQNEPTECTCGILYGLVTYVAKYEIDWDAMHNSLGEG